MNLSDFFPGDGSQGSGNNYKGIECLREGRKDTTRVEKIALPFCGFHEACRQDRQEIWAAVRRESH